MKKVENKELAKIHGGFSAAAALGIAAAILFIAGVFEGIVYPKSCSE